MKIGRKCIKTLQIILLIERVFFSAPHRLPLIGIVPFILEMAVILTIQIIFQFGLRGVFAVFEAFVAE